MEDVLYQALINGDSVLAWVGALLAAAVVKYVIAKISNETALKYSGRAWAEIRSAVDEVFQTYVGALKEANADGKLTDAEKIECKNKAIAIAKSNIGQKGLERLARILGIGVDGWIGNKVEAAVVARKELM